MGTATATDKQTRRRDRKVNTGSINDTQLFVISTLNRRIEQAQQKENQLRDEAQRKWNQAETLLDWRHELEARRDELLKHIR